MLALRLFYLNELVATQSVMLQQSLRPPVTTDQVPNDRQSAFIIRTVLVLYSRISLSNAHCGVFPHGNSSRLSARRKPVDRVSRGTAYSLFPTFRKKKKKKKPELKTQILLHKDRDFRHLPIRTICPSGGKRRRRRSRGI